MDGPLFSVVQLRGPVFGPTYYRQLRANELGCAAVFEAHLNASTNPDANYSEVIVAPNAGDHAYAWGRSFLSRLAVKCDIRSTGVRSAGKGTGNIARIKAPALLLEPGFVSNPHWAALCRTGEGIDAIGECLAESIREVFPEGGLVGFSPGHLFRGTGDTGAPVADPSWDEDPEWDSEGELALAYGSACAEFLVSYPK